MTGVEILREYLVKLGFQADTSAYKKMHDLLDGLTKKIGASTSEMGKKYLKYGTIAISAIAAIDTALVAQIGKTIKADTEYQKFALHMFTTREQAKKTKIAMDTLGESLEDIANIPELHEKYKKLIALMDRLKPKDAKADEAEYKRLRGIAFQFKELSITGKFFADQMVASLSRKLSPELDMLSSKLKAMQEFFIKNKDNIIEATAAKLTNLSWITKGIVTSVGLLAGGYALYKGFGALKNIGGFAKNVWGGIKAELALGKEIAKAKSIEAVAGVQPVYVVNSADIKSDGKDIIDKVLSGGGWISNLKTIATGISAFITAWGVPSVIITGIVAGIGVALNEIFQNIQRKDGWFGKIHREATANAREEGNTQGLAVGEGEYQTYGLMWEYLKNLFTTQASMAGAGGTSGSSGNGSMNVQLYINADPKTGEITQSKPPQVQSKLNVMQRNVKNNAK